MPLVVDASVAVKFLVREDGNDEARRLLVIPDPLIAPDWLLAEAASTFWKKVKQSELLIEHAIQHIRNMPQFFQALYPATDLIEDALALSFRLRHPVYDCLYLALAIREDCRMATADGRFSAVLRRYGFGDRLMAMA